MIHGELFVTMLFKILKLTSHVRLLDILDQCVMFVRLDLAKELVNSSLINQRSIIQH